VKGTSNASNIGKNIMQKIGRSIAALLGLDNPDKYTGHVFRRSSVCMMANTGASLMQLKAHTGHKSDTTVQGYFDTSTHM